MEKDGKGSIFVQHFLSENRKIQLPFPGNYAMILLNK